MPRPQSPARQLAADLAAAGASQTIIRNAIGDALTVPRSTLSRIMHDVQPQIDTLESSLARLKRLAIRAEAEGNHSAAIAAHRAIRDTLRELRLARSFAELDAGEDTMTF